jgi:hypothetical protein
MFDGFFRVSFIKKTMENQITILYRGSKSVIVVEPSLTIGALKKYIHDATNVPCGHQRLICKGKSAWQDTSTVVSEHFTKFMPLKLYRVILD